MNFSVTREVWANQWINCSNSSINPPVTVRVRIWKQERFPLCFTVPIVRTTVFSQLIKHQVRAVKHRDWKMLVFCSNTDSIKKKNHHKNVEEKDDKNQNTAQKISFVVYICNTWEKYFYSPFQLKLTPFHLGGSIILHPYSCLVIQLIITLY